MWKLNSAKSILRQFRKTSHPILNILPGNQPQRDVTMSVHSLKRIRNRLELLVDHLRRGMEVLRNADVVIDSHDVLVALCC